jgi:hypothetical protein
LFKNVKVPLAADMWSDDDDDDDDGDKGSGFKMVVSKAYVARQVYLVLSHREKWLSGRGLPRTWVMRDGVANDFLKDTKNAFHESADQQQRQWRDWESGLTNAKCMKKRHSRWSRHTQRLGGTSQMWTLLSFTGSFDPDFFATLKVNPESRPGQRTQQQKQAVRDAVQARDKYRLAQKHDRTRARIHEALQTDSHSIVREFLSKKATALLRDLDNGNLLHEANTLTRLSGHGRLRKSNGEFIDIGGSTGGFVRTVLDDWEPPDFNDW